jgi:DMSO reductase family type II enzyme heme b subunit
VPALLLPVLDASLETPPGPDHPAWSKAPQSPLHLSRTPPVYSTDAVDDGFRPDAAVRLLRANGQINVRVTWTDATVDESTAGETIPDGGDDHAYKKHSQHVDSFADACCIMVPATPGKHDRYPSLMMGEDQEPVVIHCFKAGVGFTVTDATGRGTTKVMDRSKGASIRTDVGWSVVLSLGSLPSHTPLAFAIWDGSREHRDGMKYFTPWYELP